MGSIDDYNARRTIMEQQRGALCGILNGAFGPHQWRIDEDGDEIVIKAQAQHPAVGMENKEYLIRAPMGDECIKILLVKIDLMGLRDVR